MKNENKDGDHCFVCALVKKKAVVLKRLTRYTYECPECHVKYNQNVCASCGRDYHEGANWGGPKFFVSICPDCAELIQDGKKEIVYVCRWCGHIIDGDDVVIRERNKTRV